MGEMMGLLRFLVKGSAAQPYRITMEGEGPALRCFCTCPAGRNAANFCKHVAGLLVGDLSKFVAEGSDDPARIVDIVAGSPLGGVAVAHKPKPSGIGDPAIDATYKASGSFVEALAGHLNPLERLGWRIDCQRDGVFAYGKLKNGAPRKTPAAYILWSGDDREIDGFFIPGNVSRPFTVRGASFGRLSAAFERFAEQLDREKSKQLPG